MNEVERTLCNLLIEDNIIPNKGFFQIEEKHLNVYCDKYHSIFGKKVRGVEKKVMRSLQED
jgi:hypothetical protein